MVGILVILLLIFLAAFFGPEQYAAVTGGAPTIRYLGISLISPEFKVFLGIGIILLEFAIIVFSMIDPILDTIRDAIKPFLRLIPLGAFVATIYRTFTPIIRSLLPENVVGAAGNDPAYIAEAVRSGAVTEGIVLTLATMILFVLTNRALGSESAEIKALRAELAKQRRTSK